VKAEKGIRSKGYIGRGLSQLILLGVMVSVVGCSIVGTLRRVEGASMEPALKSGTTVWVHKVDHYQRGDIIVFEAPLDRTRDFAKRIVGLPGETLEIKEGKVFINGQPLDEPYAWESAPPIDPPGCPGCTWPISVKKPTVPAITIEPDRFYVLGDNRNRSNDSKDFGTVPREYILGVVRP